MATDRDAKKGVESVTDYQKAREIDSSAVDLSFASGEATSSSNGAKEEVPDISDASITTVADELMQSRDVAYALLVKAKGDVHKVFEKYTAA
jgi:hypothetical protein